MYVCISFSWCIKARTYARLVKVKREEENLMSLEFYFYLQEFYLGSTITYEKECISFIAESNLGSRMKI